MPCLIALLALIAPRLTIILLVIFSDYIGNAYQTTIWPLLGFFFFPVTTLAYAFGMNSAGSIQGMYFVLVIIAVLIDIGMGGGSAAAGRSARRK